MILATRFRQVPSGICSSLAGLSFAPNPALGSIRKQQDTLPQDLRRYRFDILPIQETRICTLDKKRIGDYTLPVTQGRHVIGFAVSPRIRPYLHCYWADRIGVLQLLLPHTGPVNTVTAYAPHSGQPLAEVDRFYADLSDTLDQLPRRNIAFVAGDFNAKLGHQINGEAFMGPHARDIHNRDGHKLVLLYNCGTWALTPSELSGLESFHRRQLRTVLNVRCPQRIGNATLYEICQERPLRRRNTAARWRLFGHILRRPKIPAYTQMAAYFDPSSMGTWRGRPRTTLPVVLDADLVSSGYAKGLWTSHDLEQLRLLAQAKSKWKALERAIVAALPPKKDPTYSDTTLCRRLAKLSLATA
ncbi:hypothetical protein PHMEG_00020342 [Phytophthora megakarya]|uniref:Endonuclease/exonuclease/phosphatase domain-containing protein n=1 Tax=Phytophthora megakarya TaxID=4795 RepID=A0A225VQ98_9STRA|nr:hypothetical protein PHMEG_00020342 [Phytophthora megakarya]